LRGPRAGTTSLSAGKSFDDRQQIERAERLAHERVGTAAFRAPRLLVVRARQEDDRDLPRPGGTLQPHTQLRAAHAGHAQVEHDHVGEPLLDARLGLEGAGRLFHLDAGALERHPQELAERRLVVDEQNPHRTSSPLHVYLRCRSRTCGS